MSCIARVFVKVVAFPLKLTQKVLRRLCNAAAKAGAKAGKSCGKCGAKACRKCRRSSARTCRIFKKHSQKACTKFARSTKNLCKRCGRKCPKCCGALGRRSHATTRKRYTRLCTKCRNGHFKSSVAFNKVKGFRQRRMRTQKCSNQDYTGANCHPRKLYGRKRRLKPNSSKRKKGSNRTATNPVQHDDRSLHRNAYDVSKQHQNKIRRKSHTSPKAKNRPLAASNDPGRAFRQKAEDIERSRGKCEMHKEVGNWSKRQSQGREEADETGSSVAARTARRPESKAVPRASYEIDGERIEERPQPKLERNSRRPIAGSRAYVTDETEEMHAIRGESDTRKKNRADMPHLASARAHINDADTNINSKRNTGGEQTRSDENGAQVPGCTSVRGSKDRERRKVEHREQSKGKPKERKETDVEEDSSPEAVLPHSQATLQRESEMGSDVLCEMGDVDMPGKLRSADTEQEKRVRRVTREGRSLKQKHRKDPPNETKLVEKAGCSTDDRNSKRQRGGRQKQDNTDDIKPPSMMDDLKSTVSPVSGAVEEKKQKSKNRMHDSYAGKSVTGRHTPEARSQEVPGNSTKHLRRGKATQHQPPATDMEQKKDALALPCATETKQAKVVKATGPMPRSEKLTPEDQTMQSDSLAKVKHAERNAASGRQNCDNQICGGEQLADQTTLFGIECRVLPESPSLSESSRFA